MHPSYLLFFTIIFFTNLSVMSSNSLFLSWIFLEINLMAFIPLVMSSTNKYSSEATLKYFLVQAITSMFFMFSILTYDLLSPLNSNIFLFALMMKMAVAPCHQWMPPVAESLNWFNLFIFFSLQKINPLFILLSLTQSTKLNLLLTLYIVSSAIIGSLGGLSQNSLRKIIAYSSIAHMAWLITSFTLSNWLWIFYFTIYCMILISISMMFHTLQTFKISHLYNKIKKYDSIIISIAFLSLGGLPPFSGFLPKFFITQELFFQSFSLIMILLASTFVSLFFYIRMFIPNIILMNYINKPPIYMKQNKNYFPLTIFINISTLIICPIFFLFY